MVPLSALWLPILVSAFFVFLASNILWMMPFWRRADYKTLPDEAAFIAALRGAKSGMYMAPFMDWKKVTPEQREEMHRGPLAMLLLRNPMSEFSFPKALTLYFVYALVISTFIAYLTGHVLPAGAHYLTVFRIAGTAGILAYAFGGIPYTIWYGRPWSATIKDLVDGAILGMLIGGTFGWLWPK